MNREAIDVQQKAVVGMSGGGREDKNTCSENKKINSSDTWRFPIGS